MRVGLGARKVMCLLGLLIAACATPVQLELDAEVKKLCSIDGGVKVHEQIRLPQERFGRGGVVNFYRPTQGEDALGAEYLFKEDSYFYRSGNPQMARRHFRVIRRADGKLLAESVLYERGGGDVPGPWHGSSYACPGYAEAGEVALIKKLFVTEVDGGRR